MRGKKSETLINNCNLLNLNDMTPVDDTDLADLRKCIPDFDRMVDGDGNGQVSESDVTDFSVFFLYFSSTLFQNNFSFLIIIFFVSDASVS